ncbi:MAG: polyprenyl synthetase family protein [Alphaproteobacteria bacterium]|nr:polyprenyl synthetase family protein [Alphaproteobacteria bacterium]
MTEIEQILSTYSQKFNAELERYFPKTAAPEHRAMEAMRYSLLNGGKRLRPFLLHQTASLFDVPYETALPVAVSLEMLHTYSLIHDDLPAMDNDDLRRGKPTCHKAYDEATAILAGDGLLTYAFEVLNSAHITDAKKVELTLMLAQAAGAKEGMIAGQVLDLYTDSHKLHANAEDIIKHTEELKTGCLLRYPCEAGAVLGNATKEEKNLLIKFSRNLGIAFQITDDILDIKGDEKVVGKTLKKDKAQHKLNFVSIYGADKAYEIAVDLIEEAESLISTFGQKADNLKNLSRYFLTRNY